MAWTLSTSIPMGFVDMVHLTFASNSGAARYVASLVEAQSRLRDDTVLICPPDFVFADALRASGTKVYTIVPTVRHRDLLRFFLGNAIRSLVTAIRVARLRKSHSTLHANFLGTPIFSLFCLATLRLCGFRILLTIHDVLPHTWLFPRSLRWLERFSHQVYFHIAQRCIVLHQGAADELAEVFRIRRDHIDTIPHGSFQIADKAPPLPQGEITALIFGNIRRNKGIDLAIAAIQLLRGRKVPVGLRIVGTPFRKERPYWEECKALIAQRPDGIEYREEFVPDDELPSELGRCHFLLLPYRDFGSQSGVASLALSNGRCIVATRSGGLRELVTAETGIEISAPTVENVATALEQAVGLGKDRLGQLGLRAQAFFTHEFSWQAIAAQHLRVYNAMLFHPKERFIESANQQS